MTTRLTFPSAQRLGGRGTFAQIRNDGRKIVSHPLIAFSIGNELGFDRLGISIGRSIGNAVTRNRIKRVLRESFRKRDRFDVGRDIVLQLRRHELMTNAEYAKVTEHLVRRVQALSPESR